MLLAGDELSHTQQGNNNAYCQDNDLTWLNWELNEAQQSFCNFVHTVLHLQRTQPVFQRRKFFQGRAIHGEGIQDITWFEPSGEKMSEETWKAEYIRCLGMRLAGDLIGDVDERGEPIAGDTVLLLMNAHYEAIPFGLPALPEGSQWERLLDTASQQEPLAYTGGQPYTLHGRSIAILRSVALQEEGLQPAATSATAGSP
jgi:glycogen operon protein